jgi:hypothetical protein
LENRNHIDGGGSGAHALQLRGSRRRLSRTATFALAAGTASALALVACSDSENGGGGAAGASAMGGDDAGGKAPQTGGSNSVAGSSSTGGTSPLAGNGGNGGKAGDTSMGGNSNMAGDTSMGGDAGSGGDGDAGMGGDAGGGGDGDAGMGGDSGNGGDGEGGSGGDAEMGGSAGMAGTSQCNPKPGSKAGDGIDKTIDALDDANIMFSTAGTGVGSWDWAKGVGAGTITPASTVSLVPVDGGQSGKALHVSGEGLEGWGAALAAVLNGTLGSFDASAYGGVAFYLKGTSNVVEGANKLLLGAVMPDLVPGVGSCCHDNVLGMECYSFHRRVIDIPADWQEIKVTWDDLLNAPFGLGSTFDFNPNRIRHIGFYFNHDTVDPNATSFDVWVDGLRFLGKDEQGNVGN